VVVEGHALPEKTANSNSELVVEGYYVNVKEPVKDEITINRSRSLGF
jgi:hypothetical protein